MTQVARTKLFSPKFMCDLPNHYMWRSDVVDCPWCELDRIKAFLRNGDNYDLGGDIQWSAILAMLGDET